MSTLRDPEKVPYSDITHVIETDAIGVEYGTFRGCLDGTWLSSSPDPMTWQRSGGFAKGLWDKGVRSVVVGDLTEEWYLYSIAHPFGSPTDIALNLGRYYPDEVVQKITRMYKTLPDNATAPEVERLFGEMLSDGQVHLPVRLLARDLCNAGFPVLRYEIRWTPEQMRQKGESAVISIHKLLIFHRGIGYVTHATDRSLWTVAVPWLEPPQLDVARAWLDAVAEEIKYTESNTKTVRGVREVLTLKEDRTIKWSTDSRWEDMMKLATVLPGEAR